MSEFGYGISKSGQGAQTTEEINKRSVTRSRAILADFNAVQRAMALDPNPLVAGLCPRRAGKSYTATGTALAIGEAKPGSVCLIISLNLKMTKRNYWSGLPSGLHAFSRKYGLNLDFNSADLRWEHENGSIGYLLGCDTRESMENMRGLEADVYIVDECKSFSPSVLNELIDDVIMPQRISRSGRVLLIGTPGSVLAGPFWQATNTSSRDDKGRPWTRMAGDNRPEVLHGRDPRVMWSLHRWTLKDNTAKPEQWDNALLEKDRKGWADDHPTWRREYLGEWISTSDGLVFKYSDVRNEDPAKCRWTPQTSRDNPSGLPKELGPWRYVWGLDLGFNDPTALVVAAYSETLAELREVWSFKSPHLLLDDIEALLESTAVKYGIPDRIFGDFGGLGKLLGETLKSRGWAIEAAIKADKNDGFELCNADFTAGRIKIIADSYLEEQLVTVGWDLSRASREELAKTGRLKEDKLIPNDVTDAFLYLHRGCYHLFSRKKEAAVVAGSPEWWTLREKEQLAQAQREVREELARKASGYRLPKGPGIGSLKFGTKPPSLDSLTALRGRSN